MDKSSTVYLSIDEIEMFRKGEVPAKLLGWDLTHEEFENMINSGQIKIATEDK